MALGDGNDRIFQMFNLGAIDMGKSDEFIAGWERMGGYHLDATDWISWSDAESSTLA